MALTAIRAAGCGGAVVTVANKIVPGLKGGRAEAMGPDSYNSNGEPKLSSLLFHLFILLPLALIGLIDIDSPG